MRGRHHNVFYYFRGPSKSAGSAQAQEAALHRQVEDNTTKALINVLEHAGPALTASFLERFVPGASVDGLDQRAYHLQGGPKAHQGERRLLGISVLGEADPKLLDAPPAPGGSRVDAAIELPGGLLVLIEVKVVEYLDPQQLHRHAEEWLISAENGVPWTLHRWVDVHQWAVDAAAEAGEPVSRFLLEQLAEYLQLVGLAPFAGFRDEHFAWLAAPAAQRSWDLQAEIKAHLRTMWEAIRERLAPDEAAALGEVHANQLPLDATVAAAQTNWGEPGVNITVELTPEELQVNLVGWNAPQAALLESWLAPGGVIGAEAALDGLELAVFRRRAFNYAEKGAGKRPWWQKERFACVDRRPLGELRGTRLTDLEAEWRTDPDPSWEKLSYHLRHAWPRDQAVAAGSGLAPDLAAAVRSLLPVVAAINGA